MRFGSAADTLAWASAVEQETLVASSFVAQKYYLISTASCARLAPQLRLAATAEFLAPGGMLDRLRTAYGGFHFAKVISCEPGTQCDLLNRDLADISHVSNVDPRVLEAQLALLRDERHVWPASRTAPIVRTEALRFFPRLRPTLDRMSKRLSLVAIQTLNERVDLDFGARFSAEEFVSNAERSESSAR